MAEIHFFTYIVVKSVRDIIRIYGNSLTLAIEHINLVEFWTKEASIREILTLATLNFKLLRPLFDYLVFEIVNEMVLDEQLVVKKDHK